MKIIEDIYIGYWREKETEKSIFPIPIPNSWKPSKNGKQDFLNWLIGLIDKKGRKTKGKDITCKICGKKLDSTEYVLEFRRNSQHFIFVYIPHGFLHYVKAHNVRPPLDFFRTIRDRQMKNITNFIIEICENTYIVK